MFSCLKWRNASISDSQGHMSVTILIMCKDLKCLQNEITSASLFSWFRYVIQEQKCRIADNFNTKINKLKIDLYVTIR